MAVLLAENFSAADGPVIPPLKPSGELWAWCMFYDGMWKVAYADSLNELVDVLIPGYLSMDEEGRDVTRIKFAIHAATICQAGLLAEAEPGSLTTDQERVLLHPKYEAPTGVLEWNAPTPLVTVATNYEPYAPVVPPVQVGDGLVIEVDPSDEHSLLFSLSHVGFVNVMSSI